MCTRTAGLFFWKFTLPRSAKETNKTEWKRDVSSDYNYTLGDGLSHGQKKLHTVNLGLVFIKYKNLFWTYITVPQK